MRSDEIKIKLDEIKNQINTVQSEADNVIIELRAETLKIACDWIDKTAEEFVKSNPTRVNSLGKDWVTQFKTELENFKKSLPKDISSEFNGLNDYWPHQKPVKVSSNLADRQYEYPLAEKFGEVVNGLVNILYNHGFFPKPNSDTYPWEKKNNTGPYKITFRLQIVEKYEYFPKYLSVLKKYNDLCQQKISLEKSYNAEKANELWSAG